MAFLAPLINQRSIITQMAANEQLKEALRDVRFEVYGQEMIEKVVKRSGNSGRIYLPPDWIGKRVKIVRVD